MGSACPVHGADVCGACDDGYVRVWECECPSDYSTVFTSRALEHDGLGPYPNAACFADGGLIVSAASSWLRLWSADGRFEDGFVGHDYDDYEDERRDGHVFVHLSVLRAAARGSRGFPQPGQRLVFRAEQGRQGLRANMGADADDGSFLSLPLESEERASSAWARYRYLY